MVLLHNHLYMEIRSGQVRSASPSRRQSTSHTKHSIDTPARGHGTRSWSTKRTTRLAMPSATYSAGVMDSWHRVGCQLGALALQVSADGKLKRPPPTTAIGTTHLP